MTSEHDPRTSEHDPRTSEHDPLLDDFWDAEEEDEARRPRMPPWLRVLRLLGVLVLIVALLIYFVAPFNNFFVGTTSQWLRAVPQLRFIPIAPHPAATATLPA